MTDDTSPPARMPTPAQYRRRMRLLQWLLVPVGAVAAWFVVSAALETFEPKESTLSPDYSGAPVEASEASATLVVSSEGTVAYARGASWVEAQDYIDLSSQLAGLDPRTTLTGAHLTADPNVDVPQLVMVIEVASDATSTAYLSGLMDGYFDGIEPTGSNLSKGERQPLTTNNGLEGYRQDFSMDFNEVPTVNTAIAVGHGARAVMIQWTSYLGPVDEAALDELVQSLRVDP